MKYRKLGQKIQEDLSILGFGLMRLPVDKEKDNQIDYPKAEEMFLTSIDRGINYFDTAYPYHGGQSEVFLGKMMQKHKLRDKIHIATKLPSWKIKKAEDLDRIFNEQLTKLQVDSIDFYLFHALGKKHWDNLLSLDALTWAEQKKAQGKIRYLGFSFHDDYPAFQEILDGYHKWEFCQIQYNYMDEDKQATSRGLKLAHSRGIGVIIMEPILGGGLATPPPAIRELWKTSAREWSPAAWALLWVWNQSEVGLVLSGMSTLSQIDENIRTAAAAKTGLLTARDLALVREVKETYPKLRPVMCTACGYCLPCPGGIEIPKIFELFNEGKIYQQPGRSRWFYNHGRKGQPNGADCTKCGECESRCPQFLKISQLMEKIHQELVEE